MNSIVWTFQLRLIVALALGFLVGLERESTKIEQQKLVFGGVRTHPIISMYGFACAWLYQIGVTFFLPVGLASMTVLTAIAYYAKIRGERYGSTSEVSALLTFVVGALALLVDVWVAMALGIVNAILLSEKARLEKYVYDLDRVDFLATLKFLLVTLIILPVLPDQEYTEFHLNPASIWKIVIVVSTIGFIGYALAKKFGSKIGFWLSGLLGGIVSSTAVTIAAGRIAQRSPQSSSRALQASLLAGSMMYLRLLVLIAVISPAFVPALWWKCAALAVVGLALALSVRHSAESVGGKEVPGLENPFEVTPAVIFAVLFVFLSVITALVQTTAGSAGLLTLAAVVGVTDITPFILSLVQNPATVFAIGVQAILLAMMSNTLVKGASFAFLAPPVRRQTMVRFGLWSLLHLPLIFVQTV
ncbi:MAG TPA: MgtC/SapB family protein [Bacteroidota bacterium]